MTTTLPTATSGLYRAANLQRQFHHELETQLRRQNRPMIGLLYGLGRKGADERANLALEEASTCLLSAAARSSWPS